MRRQPINRTIDPRQGHQRAALAQFGVQTPAEIARDVEERTAAIRGTNADIPRVTGSWADGTALSSLVQALARVGLIVDETDGGDAIDTIDSGLRLVGPLTFSGGTSGMSVAVAAGAGGGATSSISAPGNEWAFIVAFSTGTVPAAGKQLTITFSNARANVSYAVIIIPRNIRAVQAAFYPQTPATTSIEIFAANTPTASVSHAFEVVIVERST